MKSIKVGLGRIYNARGRSVVNSREIAMEFTFEEIQVYVTLGPNTRHPVMKWTFGKPMPIGKADGPSQSRQAPHEIPTPDIFPADVYCEIEAMHNISVNDDVAELFNNDDIAARDIIFKKLKECSKLQKALDFVAGFVGLRLHYLMIATQIVEQGYAYYEDKGRQAISTTLKVVVVDTFELDSEGGWDKRLKSQLPTFDGIEKRWQDASDTLSWLLRSWAAKDDILKFVSLFTCLERVVPPLPNDASVKWEKHRTAIHSIIMENTEVTEINELIKFITDLKCPQPSLSERFQKWASEAQLVGWNADVLAFNKFSRMRNQLLHRGNPEITFKLNLEAGDLRTLEDIVERYVSLSLFGDINIYKHKDRVTGQFELLKSKTRR